MTSTSRVIPNPNRGVLISLWSFAFLSYLLRTNISVAQQFMARDLSLSNIQIGYVFSAFLIGYTLFQVPAGILGDRFGPRLVLTICGIWWALTTLLTGLVPGMLVTGTALVLGSLLLFRFLHGVGQAATYPVAMAAVAEWFHPNEHALINSIIFTGSTLGAAFSPPLVAYIMNAMGWRATFYITALLPAVLTAVWWRQHGRAERQRRVPKEARTLTPRGTTASLKWWHLITRRDIFFLCLSYLLYCYAISIFVYWLYKYLVDVRHLSIVNSGWATSLPWIVASVFVPFFGYVSTRASRKFGVLSGRRLIASVCLVAASLLMSVGAGASNITLALGTIALSVGLLFSTESSYFATAIEIARNDAGTASGLMNFSGNLGGVLSTTLVPVLVAAFGWVFALLSGSVFALLAALFWFLIPAQE